jgi:hypothetical protein
MVSYMLAESFGRIVVTDHFSIALVSLYSAIIVHMQHSRSLIITLRQHLPFWSMVHRSGECMCDGKLCEPI